MVKCIILFLMPKDLKVPSREISALLFIIIILIQTSFSSPLNPSFDALNMGQFFSTPRPRPQPEQAHEPLSQSGTSPSSAQQPFDQPSSMGHTLSAIPSSDPPSHHPVGPVHPTPSSLPPLYPPSKFRKEIMILSTEAKKMLAAKRAERRHQKRKRRLEAAILPLQPATRKQTDRQKRKENAISLRKHAWVQRERKRAKKAATSPDHFPTIDIHVEDDDDDEELIMSQQSVNGPDSERGTECKATKTKPFAGLIVIQDYLRAMLQAISEHTKGSALLTEPGRHHFTLTLQYRDRTVAQV